MSTKKTKTIPEYYAYKRNRLRWPIAVYKEWYEYSRLADTKEKRTFDEWFDVEIYAEPMRLHEDIKVISNTNNKLTIEIDLTVDVRTLGYLFLELLSRHKVKPQKTWKGKWSEDWKEATNTKSQAARQPSKSKKDIKIPKLEQAREIYTLKKGGLSNLDIALKLKMINDSDYEYASKDASTQRREYSDCIVIDSKLKAADKRIRRNLNVVEDIFKSIKNETFP